MFGVLKGYKYELWLDFVFAVLCKGIGFLVGL